MLRLAANESPHGPFPAARAAALRQLDTLHRYPASGEDLVARLAEIHGLDPGQIALGNGGDAVIGYLSIALLQAGDEVITGWPSFPTYVTDARKEGAVPVLVPLRADGAMDLDAMAAAITPRTRLIWVCSPNNPTGASVGRQELDAFLDAVPAEVLVVLDEAYSDLLPEPQWERRSLEAGNLVVLHSMTKYWGLAGLRLGHAVAAPAPAARLRAAAPPWSVNACAQQAGLAALADLEHHRRAVALLVAERDRLAVGLAELGWTVEPTAAGFFLIHGGDAPALRRALLDRGCLVRDCTSFGLPGHVRVSPRLPEQNALLLAAFAALTPPEAAA